MKNKKKIEATVSLSKFDNVKPVISTKVLGDVIEVDKTEINHDMVKPWFWFIDEYYVDLYKGVRQDMKAKQDED